MGGFKAMQLGRNRLVFRARRTAARLTMLYKVLCVPTHDLQKGDARTRSGAIYIRIHRARASKEQGGVSLTFLILKIYHNSLNCTLNKDEEILVKRSPVSFNLYVRIHNS